jgi:hypothetical protein
MNGHGCHGPPAKRERLGYILVDLADCVVAHPEAAKVFIEGVSATGGAAYVIAKGILKLLGGKKSLKGAPITNKYTVVNNNFFVNDTAFTRAEFDALRSGGLDKDFERLTVPLRKGRGIGNLELRLNNEKVEVSSKEREFIAKTILVGEACSDSPIPKFKKSDVWLEGGNSHSKRNNNGVFETTDGVRLGRSRFS